MTPTPKRVVFGSQGAEGTRAGSRAAAHPPQRNRTSGSHSWLMYALRTTGVPETLWAGCAQTSRAGWQQKPRDMPGGSQKPAYGLLDARRCVFFNAVLLAALAGSHVLGFPRLRDVANWRAHGFRQRVVEEVRQTPRRWDIRDRREHAIGGSIAQSRFRSDQAVAHAGKLAEDLAAAIMSVPCPLT